MRTVTLEQGSLEWLAWRTFGIGSSDAPVIVKGKHFDRDRHALWQEKRGELLPKERSVWINERMRRGQVLEGDVRNWYVNWIKKSVSPLCAFHATKDYIKASLDGWEPFSRTILEIKCPGKKDHDSALNNTVPDKYLPQLQHQALVTGAKQVHYLSYNPTYPKLDRYALVSYHPEKDDISKLELFEEIFWGCVVSGIPPTDNLFYS